MNTKATVSESNHGKGFQWRAKTRLSFRWRSNGAKIRIVRRQTRPSCLRLRVELRIVAADHQRELAAFDRVEFMVK